VLNKNQHNSEHGAVTLQCGVASGQSFGQSAQTTTNCNNVKKYFEIVEYLLA
jgi:hypothetical protein